MGRPRNSPSSPRLDELPALLKRPTLRYLAALSFVLLLALPSAVAPDDSAADFVRCRLNGTQGADGGSGNTINVLPARTVKLRFGCPGVDPSLAPSLSALAPSSDFSIGPATAEGPDVARDWAFEVAVSAAATGSTTLRFFEPGTSASQDLILEVKAPIPTLKNCQEERNAATQSSGGTASPGTLEARTPGSPRFVPVEESSICLSLWRHNIAAPGAPPIDALSVLAIPALTPVNGVSAWPFPDQTVFRISGEVSGFSPGTAYGGLEEPSFETEGARFIAEGLAFSQKRIASVGLSPEAADAACAQATATTGFGFAVISADSPLGPFLEGSFIGTDAYNASTPSLAPTGALSFQVEGCGDGNPGTLDGFYDAQLAEPFLTHSGLSQSALRAASDPAVQAMFKVTDNGEVATANFKKIQLAGGGSGVRMNYASSYSKHSLNVGLNKKAARFATKCAKKKSARVRRQDKRVRSRGKFRTDTYLICKPSKGKSTKLRIS